ncbi:LPXTG cell wall anchor domain-containing protein [Kitasatospora sp. NPDC001683]
MRENRSRSTIVTAATLGVLLATGVVMASPAAYAADLSTTATSPRATATPTATHTASSATRTSTGATDPATAAAPAPATEVGKPSLTVQEPASIGNGGRPVEFTEAITNPGTAEASYTLRLDASNGYARSPGRITIESLDADGSWKPVEPAFSQASDGFHFTGEIHGVTVAAGATRTLRLRLAAPLDNDWAGLDGTVKLSSAIVDPDAKTVLAESTRNVALKALKVQVKGAPTSAVIGGAPAEFDVTATNPSASRYDNASFVVQADRHSTLQVQQADGSWQDVTATPTPGPGNTVLYHLTEDRTLAADASVTKHVRLAFTAGAATGETRVNPWAVLGEGGQHPAYVGPQGFPVELTAATAPADEAATTGTDTGSTVRTALGSDSSATADTRLAGGELARTGSTGMRQAALGAAALLAVGIGAVFFARRRRSA